MARRPSKRRHSSLIGEDLNLTPVMNLFMIIIPFLLLTAVFAKTAIIDIYLPQEGQGDTGAANVVPEILTIKIAKIGFELGGIGKGVVIPKIDNSNLNFKQLTAELIKIKDRYPNKEDAVLLFEPDTLYDTVIKVMDACRETTEGTKKTLFPFVSLGEDK